jgi:hypothetical protein
MSHQNFPSLSSLGVHQRGRPPTARRQTWHKTILSEGRDDTPDSTLITIEPRSGCTYVRGYDWPPRGRGRGESLTSPRRIAAKLRASEVFHLRMAGHTWQTIAHKLGFADASGPYRAYKRTLDRVDYDNAQRQREKRFR